METQPIDNEYIRAEGEGMNFVEPPAIPRGKLALMNAKIRLARMMEQIDDSERTQILASALALTLSSIAKRVKVPQLLALTAAAGVGFFIGVATRGKVGRA